MVSSVVAFTLLTLSPPMRGTAERPLALDDTAACRYAATNRPVVRRLAGGSRVALVQSTLAPSGRPAVRARTC